MPVSESQRKANEKYNKNSTKQVTIRLINKEYELYEQYCKEHNKTKSGCYGNVLLYKFILKNNNCIYKFI